MHARAVTVAFAMTEAKRIQMARVKGTVNACATRNQLVAVPGFQAQGVNLKTIKTFA